MLLFSNLLPSEKMHSQMKILMLIKIDYSYQTIKFLVPLVLRGTVFGTTLQASILLASKKQTCPIPQ
jgi:hypothetical protein